MEKGENIGIFLMDGTPSGTIQCTIDNWNGIAYKIPRTELDNCKDRNHLKYSGIYFLFGKSDDEENDVIYVGQAVARQNGEGVLYRLQEHDRDPNKDFWTDAIAFTAKDGSMGPSEISYLEHRFFTLAVEAKIYEVKNDKKPNPGVLSEGQRIGLEKYIDYTKLIVGILGYKVFEKSGEIEFIIKHDNKTAIGKRTAKGFVVLTQSYIKQISSDGYIQAIKLRDKYKSFISEDYKILKDILFSSPSAAAVFVLGRSSNGYKEWKTIDGKTLKEVD